MISNIQHLISQHNLILEPKDPFSVTVSGESEGMQLAKEILYHLSDKKTLLFLSGGRTPKAFYETIAKEEKLDIGAVGLIDERYGPPAMRGKALRAGPKMHLDSNEWMIQQTGLLGYLKYKNTPFYPILCHSERSEESRSFANAQDDNISLEDTASQYDETLRFLFNGFQKSIGILGIGLDGHTAGLPINTSLENKDQSLVTSFTDFPGPQKERISMTFLGLSMLDFLLVMVFGKDKLHALQAMFAGGSEDPPALAYGQSHWRVGDIPARFFKRPDIAQKTLIITDQKI